MVVRIFRRVGIEICRTLVQEGIENVNSSQKKELENTVNKLQHQINILKFLNEKPQLGRLVYAPTKILKSISAASWKNDKLLGNALSRNPTKLFLER